MDLILTTVLFASFFIMIFLGVPIAFSLALSGLLVALMDGVSPTMMVQQLYAGLDTFTLLAIPLFILAGELMGTGGITEKLVAFSKAMVGHIKGGLGHVTVVAEMIMSGISGSGTSDAAALGGIMIPAMVKEGYPRKVAAAINAASTTMGPIIPPSIMMVVYGAYGNVSIGALFLGGALPGLIVGLTQMVTIYIYAKRGLTGVTAERRFSIGAVAREGKSSILALIVPIIIIGGLVAGFFTATEAAMVASVYCLLVSVFVYRELKPGDLPDLFKRSAITSAHPLLCIAGASVFGWVLAYLQVPELVVQLAGGITKSATLTLLFVSLLFGILGTFMDAVPAIITFLPVVTALGEAAHINPVHMGVIVTTVLSFGLMTPPYGLTLLLSSDLAKVKMEETMGVLLPFYISLVVTILLLVFFPQIALAIPSWLMSGM